MKARLARPAALALALLALAACGGDDGGGGEPAADTAGDGAATELSSFDTITELNDELSAAGIACALEYEGLVDDTREISQCTIDGGQAILTVWYDAELQEAFLAPEGAEPPAAVAYGENWSVETSDAATAASVAEAAGGTTTDP